MLTVKSTTLSSIALASALLLAACTTTSRSENPGMASNWSAITGKDWQLSMVMDGSKTLTPMSPVLATANFTKDSKVVGSTGCNRYFGTYEENDGKLKLSPLGATQMMCVEDAMEIENAFNNAMEKVTDWQLAKDALVLSDTNGKPIMEFVPITP